MDTRISTWVTVSIPSVTSTSSGTQPDASAATYQRLRPTRSISKAQQIEATTPAAEVVKPYSRLVCSGNLKNSRYSVGIQVIMPLITRYVQNQITQMVKVRPR